MMRAVRARRRLALSAAAVVLALDLADALLGAPRAFHPRPPAVLALAAVLAAALLALAPRIASRTLALGAGIAAGGALATVTSALAWSRGVPDPIVREGVAFNLADVAIALGDTALLAAAVAHAWTHRDRLQRPA
jgi:lipoprotein signal peptidase